MRRKTILLLSAGGAIWLSAFGFFDSPAPAIAAEAGKKKAEARQADKPKNQAKAGAPKAKAKPKPKPVDVKGKPKPDEMRAKAKAEVDAAVGSLVEAAVKAFARKPRAREAVRAVARDVLAAPQLQQFEKQFAGPFRQLLRTEMHFIRVVCQPTKREYEQIDAVGEKVLKEAIKKFAEVQQRMQRGMRAGDRKNYPSDPRKVIAEGLMKSVKATLSPEQAARYQTELERRAAAQKRVALRNLLAKLDKELVLTADQRGKLGETLDANWQDGWGHIQMLMNINHYCPQLPDNKVLPILTEHQKEVWRGIPKNSNVFFGFHGLGMMQGVVIAEEVWDEEQPEDVQEPAEGEAAAKPDRKAEIKE